MKKIYSITVISSLLFITACSKDFLEVKPQQSVLTEDVFKSMPTSRAAVNGLYSMMQSYSYYGRDAMVIPEVLSDNATRSVRSGNRYTGMNTVTHTATDANVSRMWSQMYQVITNTNAIIANQENIKKVASSLQQEEAAQLVGEAYAVRALVYFDLMRFFARPLKFTADGSHLGVPLVINPIVNITEVVYPARNTAAEVYTQIDKDLTAAIALLPQSGNVISNGAVNSTLFKIRMNKFSTLALKARVALYKSDWVGAADAANQVIASGRYSLYTFGTMLQDFRSQNSPESLFEIANNTNDNPGTDSYAYLCSQQGYGEMLGTMQSMNSRSTGTTLSTFRGLYEAYSATDIRRAFIALGNRNSIGGETNVPIPTKYINISTYMENTKVLRLAEMYLIRGEANVQLAIENSNSSLLTSSLTDINLIRKSRDTASATKPYNAVLTGTPPAGSISAAAFIDSIFVERRKEFAFEGQRLFDLNRRQLNFVKISSGGNATSRLIQYTATTSNFYYRTILPIPVAQVQNNVNMVQNPGF
ncbi:MAG: hypothetical protein RLY89_368 [Bacteroidota bacterium]|jgi:hypothetical protein